MSLPPGHVSVLVIGAGPAGSYAASALAREGIDVAVFEAAKFPRYHVGESLIPSIRHHLRFIGAEEKLASHGFVRKPGSAIKFNQFKREGYTDFIALGHNNNAWNVVRSEFDKILMDHSRQCGANVYELTRVNSIQFSHSDPTRPISATWTQSTLSGTTTFDYVIDASGRNGLFSTTYLNNRHFNTSLKNIAVWGYWTGVATYGLGTPREGAPWFEALTDESGWAWFIPLHDGTTSVGIVMNQKIYNQKMKQPFSHSPLHSRVGATHLPGIANHYLANIALAPGVLKLIGNGILTNKDKHWVRSASDFSYSASQYAGNGFRIIGDAGAFIDPFFSSGVHLALTSALSAAATVCAAIRGDCSEQDAAAWHTKRVSTSYTRFQVVVLSAYKQIQAQNVNVLSDIDEDNYDRAFAFLRPLIQGASDMGARLSETELQKSLDFCVNLFNPTSPEQHERVAGRVGKELLDVTAPIVDPALFEGTKAVVVRCAGGGNTVPAREWANIIGSRIARGIVHCMSAGGGCVDINVKWNVSLLTRPAACERETETEMVLAKVNARRVVHAEYGVNNLEAEVLDGFAVRLEKGRLGLTRV